MGHRKRTLGLVMDALLGRPSESAGMIHQHRCDIKVLRGPERTVIVYGAKNSPRKYLVDRHAWVLLTQRERPKPPPL